MVNLVYAILSLFVITSITYSTCLAAPFPNAEHLPKLSVDERLHWRRGTRENCFERTPLPDKEGEAKKDWIFLPMISGPSKLGNCVFMYWDPTKKVPYVFHALDEEPEIAKSEVEESAGKAILIDLKQAPDAKRILDNYHPESKRWNFWYSLPSLRGKTNDDVEQWLFNTLRPLERAKAA